MNQTDDKPGPESYSAPHMDELPRSVSSTDPGTLRPPAFRTDGSNAFAHHSMAVRVPAIIAETVQRNPDFSPCVRDSLLRLRDEVAGDAPLRIVEPPAPDHDLWMQDFVRFRDDTWLQTEWFFGEMLVYRRIVESARFWSTLRDPFAPFKHEEQESDDLWNALGAALEPGGDVEQRLYSTLLRALWGNRLDLSLKNTAALGTKARDEHLVSNDIPLVVRHLASGESGSVHIIADNAGTELGLDLALTDLLLTEGLAHTVTLHVKMQPVLVSDAIVADVLQLLDHMQRRSREARDLAIRLTGHSQRGRLQVVPDFFWTTARRLWDLPLRLQAPMTAARLVIGKGDVNYRRATNDAAWPSAATLADAVRGFPAPLLLLRTLKSDTLVGVDESRQEQLDASVDEDWRTSGAFGVAQFAP